MPKPLYHPPWHGAAALSVSLWGVRCYKFTACLKADILVNVLKNLVLSIPGFCLIMQIGIICTWGLKNKTRKDHLWLHTLRQSPREYLHSQQNGSNSLNMNIPVLFKTKLPPAEMVEVKVWTCTGASYPECPWQMWEWRRNRAERPAHICVCL